MLKSDKELLSAPQFFVFVAKAARATEDPESSLAGAVSDLMLQIRVMHSEQGPQNVQLERAVLDVMKAILEGVERPIPVLSQGRAAAMGQLGRWISRREDAALLPVVCRMLLDFDKAVWRLRDQEGGKELRLLAGGSGASTTFIFTADIVNSLHTKYRDVACREGLQPDKSMLCSLLRHMALMDRDNDPAMVCMLGRFIGAFFACVWVNRGGDSVLQLGIPEGCRSDVARALGTCVAKEEEHFKQIHMLEAIKRVLCAPELSRHISSFLGAPECIARLVDIAATPGLTRVHLPSVLSMLEMGHEQDPPGTLALLQMAELTRLTDLAFQPDMIAVIRARDYDRLLNLSAAAAHGLGLATGPMADVQRVLSEAGSPAPWEGKNWGGRPLSLRPEF